MRSAFIEALSEAAKRDKRIILMTGDLGFGVLDDFRRELPDQFFNVGVAEQNLAGVGAGLALTGHVVFTYSIGNFPTLRCLEQLRNDVAYHQANVKIVTIGGGMAYGGLGISHHATEDLAILRALPGMAVVAPGDPVETAKLVPQIIAHEGPVYLRLGRAGERSLVDPSAEVTLGLPNLVRDGSGVLLLTTGGMLEVALDAAEVLGARGIQPAVASVHTLSPLDTDAILDLLAPFDIVITCEEHTIRGGLGGAVAEVMAEGDVNPIFRRFGLAGGFASGVGGQEYLREVNQIAAHHLVECVENAAARLRSRPAAARREPRRELWSPRRRRSHRRRTSAIRAGVG